MADVEFDGYGADEGHVPDPRVAIGKMVSIAGALTSLALVAGLGVWGYRLAVRDVSGVPVVRALEGPARIAPDDPGGELAEHQGLAVNVIAAEGMAAAPADTLRLAPKPVELSDSDEPGATVPAAARGIEADPLPAPAPAALPDATAPITEMDEAARMAALAEELASGAAPLAPAAREPLEEGTSTSSLEIIASDVPGVSRSMRPQTRPGSEAAPAAGPDGDLMVLAALEAASQSLAGPEEDAPEAAAVATVDPASLAPGTRLVQLGAFDSEATASAEWDKLTQRFSALLDGKARVIQSAESGGRTFYRLRAQGFEDLAEARRFCAALVAENAACIPVQIR